MKSVASRIVAVFTLAMLCWLAVLGATSTKRPTLQPGKLIILSTTDVKGKTTPCG